MILRYMLKSDLSLHLKEVVEVSVFEDHLDFKVAADPETRRLDRVDLEHASVWDGTEDPQWTSK